MITLKETIYHPDGKTTITEKGFTNKNQVVKLLKKYAAVPGKNIYELTKFNECFFDYNGTKRKFELLSE